MVFLTERVFELDSVFEKLSHTTSSNSKKRKKAEIAGEIVKVSSLRLTTFKEKGVACRSCGREGTHFRLQRSDREEKFHLGLWSQDGVEMTKDHIVPRSKGGLDTLGNMQTMCEKCNGKKSNAVTEEDFERGEYRKREEDLA